VRVIKITVLWNAMKPFLVDRY